MKVLRSYYPLLLILTTVVACSVEPRDIAYGSDMCEYCKMTVVDQRHAAQLVTSKGRIYMFDAIECLVNYTQDNGDQPFAHLLVNDYQDPGTLIDAMTSIYLISEAIPSPMGAYLSALRDEANANSLRQQKGGETFTWPSLKEHFKKQMTHK